MSRIKDLPLNERPREKALRYGIETLSATELLAVVISSGVQGVSAINIAENLINLNRGLNGFLKITLKDLITQRGISKASAVKILAIIELSKRFQKVSNENDECFHSAKQIFEKYHLTIGMAPHEQMVLIMLNNRNVFLKEKIIYQGTTNGVTLSNREILVEIMISDASKFILIHNHPGGNPEPSKEDINTTIIIKKEASQLGLLLLDHIIIYSNGYYSMGEHNLI